MGFGGLNSTLGEFDWGLGELGDRREEAVVGFGGGGEQWLRYSCFNWI